MPYTCNQCGDRRLGIARYAFTKGEAFGSQEGQTVYFCSQECIDTWKNSLPRSVEGV